MRGHRREGEGVRMEEVKSLRWERVKEGKGQKSISEESRKGVRSVRECTSEK